MILNSAKTQSSHIKSRWLTLAAILVFLLLALIIWRWFDYQIVRLTFPSHENKSSMLMHSFTTPTDSIKSHRHE